MLAALKTPAIEHKHTLLEDTQAIVIGTALIALALNMYAKCTLITGGATGLALLTHYFTGWTIGLALFAINLPFYWLGYKRMGLAFIIRTLIAISSLALLTDQLPRWVSFNELHPLFAALMGGGLIGLGFIIVFRHGASLGGVNILVLHWQAKYRINAGKTQMAIDVAILLSALLIAPVSAVLYSLLGCVLVNVLMILNFKPSRYLGHS
ncbi:YitT family protein [Pseudomonas sp. P115]|uniref:YitT family protein n=1 Tax=Pseudomonas pisciculturae TaxID=2730413 RepID=UPI001892789A|nr:YitT family protein [Pseudomonas pisciculturae]MBF6029810.1 YitT family protein [Pseudomonas pisciculturae]